MTCELSLASVARLSVMNRAEMTTHAGEAWDVNNPKKDHTTRPRTAVSVCEFHTTAKAHSGSFFFIHLPQKVVKIDHVFPLLVSRHLKAAAPTTNDPLARLPR